MLCCGADGSGAAVVADLGLARHVAAAGEAMTGETGTYFYMAPEVQNLRFRNMSIRLAGMLLGGGLSWQTQSNVRFTWRYLTWTA